MAMNGAERPRPREIYEVVVRDGTRLLCEAKAFGGIKVPVSIRWSVASPTSLYVGPIVLPERDPESIAALIEDWWSSVKPPGYESFQAERRPKTG
jgi:hypothetical protein